MKRSECGALLFGLCALTACGTDGGVTTAGLPGTGTPSPMPATAAPGPVGSAPTANAAGSSASAAAPPMMMPMAMPALPAPMPIAGSRASAPGPVGGNAGAGGMSGSAMPAGAGSPGVAEPTSDDAPRPSPGCGTAKLPTADQDLTLQHGGAMRRFILHVPPGSDANTPIPLVLSIHGYTSSYTGQRGVSGMNKTADQYKYIVAYPQGTGEQADRGFNAGVCCGGASSNKVDDVGFMRAIVADVGKRACVDLRRVYATGISNGGMMSFRLACEADDMFAAVAPIVGLTWVTPCEPKRGVPILSFLGTDDMIVTYKMAVPSSEGWAMRNECKSGPKTEPHGKSSCKIWTDCKDGAEVQVCSMQGQQHCWTGNANCNTDINASDALSKFFQRFKLPTMP